MRFGKFALGVLALGAQGFCDQSATQMASRLHQTPDQDGVYYAGPEVTAPRLLRTVRALYPSDVPAKDMKGMTVLAMVIGVNGKPANIQTLHHHGTSFDEAALAAVMHSTFAPGTLAGKPVPVWIDVRVVFHADGSDAIPQVLITERDLAPPGDSQLEDKHHNPLSYTPPFPIHTVDADFTDPFTRHPWVQVAVVTVLVGKDGWPKDVRIRRGPGFGLDEKAVAAVRHYRFFPATQKGIPIEARRDVMVSFSKF